jgi:hypothetical protein
MPGIHTTSVSGRTGALAAAAVAITIAGLAIGVRPNRAMADPPVDLPAAILDRYTGYYALSISSVITVTRAGSQLMVQLPGQPAVEIQAQTPASFVCKIMDARIDFMPNPPMEITALVLHQQGLDHVAPRIDAAQAQAMAAADEQRAKAGTR